MSYLEMMSCIYTRVQSPLFATIKLPMQGFLSGKRRMEATMAGG